MNMRRWKRHILLFLGFSAVALALIGILLPVMPTTPFALLAAFFFTRSSPRHYDWLISLPKIGPSIRNWHEHRAIDFRSKILALAMMSASAAYILLISDLFLPVKLAVLGILASVGVFILTRPACPQKKQ